MNAFVKKNWLFQEASPKWNKFRNISAYVIFGFLIGFLLAVIGIKYSIVVIPW